jgi:hypothetical protein
MINKVLNSIKKKPIAWAFMAIFFLGIFLRSYHFSDWLHFELDQSRDAKVINLAIQEGPENLPLLGPKAAGTFLRLGPAFYYFKYLSALVFGNTPSGVAMIIMIFGILAIPVFYLFIRRYFDQKISLSLMFIFSVSLFLVMYSRFSWNPNSLPLFILLAFYALLKAVDENEKNKNTWFLVFTFSLIVATQLHFLAFVAVPAISLIFLVIKRPKIKIKYWIGAVAIALVLYSPAILNDFKTGGDNSSQFLKVTEKKSGKSSHNIFEKIVKNYEENSLGHFLLISGRENEELPRVSLNRAGVGFICDQNCKNNIYPGILALVIFTAGLLLLVRNLYRSYFEKAGPKKDFIILLSIWFVVAYGLFTPLAFDLSPRFWLLIAGLPFIFLGLILEYIDTKITNTNTKKTKIYSTIFLGTTIIILAISNLWAIRQRFWQLKNAPYQSFDIGADKILKERTRVTLEQQYMIVDYIKNIYDQNKYPVYLNSEPFYRRSLLFELDQRKILEDDFRNATGADKIYEHGNYFLLHPTLSNFESDIAKYVNYQEVARKQFGTLTLIQLSPKPEAINAVKQDFTPKKSTNSPGVPVRYKWEQIFNDSAGDESD